MTRPLLLLDVDGPLNPYARKGHERNKLPLPYKTLRLRPAGWELARKPLRVWVSEAHGPMLLDFAAEHDVELAWATTWMHDANTMIGPEIGLPLLPVVDFGTHPGAVRGWKYPAVLAFAQGRPVAWLDDDFRVAAHRRAQDEFLASRAPAATLLHHVDPRVGVTAADLDAVAAWLTGVSR